MVETFETPAVSEIHKFVNRVKPLMSGNGIVLSTKNNTVPFIDLYENSVETPDFDEFVKGKNYDYAMVIFPKYCVNSAILEKILQTIKGGGYLVIYLPHKFYCEEKIHWRFIPHDILLMLKQIAKVQFEIIDFQTYGFTGSYHEQNLNTTEYAFQMVVKKSNDNFVSKPIGEDKGQEVEL